MMIARWIKRKPVSEVVALSVAALFLVCAITLTILTGLLGWMPLGVVFAVFSWGGIVFASGILQGLTQGNTSPSIPLFQSTQNAGYQTTSGNDLFEDDFQNRVLQTNMDGLNDGFRIQKELRDLDEEMANSYSYSYSAGNSNYDNSWADPNSNS